MGLLTNFHRGGRESEQVTENNFKASETDLGNMARMVKIKKTPLKKWNFNNHERIKSMDF